MSSRKNGHAASAPESPPAERQSPDHVDDDLVDDGREVKPRGPIISIGGAEDKANDRAVLSDVVHRAGGKNAVIAVFPAASSIPEELAQTYDAIFSSMGAEVRIVKIETRADAESPRALEQLEGATAIFFTGGAQGRIVSLLGGTPLARALRRAHRSGVLVAGTSAGASVVCDHMIASGKKGYAPRRQSVSLAPGLGLTKRLVIDQHFAQRHRIGRLFAAVALNPFLLGVGIDEDTAIVLGGDNRIEVVGRGTVTIVDGSRIVYTDIHETPASQPASLLGLQVHVLTKGCRFDVETRSPSFAARARELADRGLAPTISVPESVPRPTLIAPAAPAAPHARARSARGKNS